MPDNGQILLLTLVLALSVALTRFAPFLVFRKTDRLPGSVSYLGKVLPAAMMGLLVVYCFKDYSLSDYASLVPAVIASAATIALHIWKRNTILSIFTGTAVYMLLIRILPF